MPKTSQPRSLGNPDHKPIVVTPSTFFLRLHLDRSKQLTKKQQNIVAGRKHGTTYSLEVEKPRQKLMLKVIFGDRLINWTDGLFVNLGHMMWSPYH
jgi:hypothetical protein